MKKFLLNIGAFLALLSFPAYEVYAPAPIQISAMADTIGDQVGIVFPTNVPSCLSNSPRPVDPPLPKNISHATWYNTDWPPVRYQKNTHINVIFETPEQIQTEETGGKPCRGTVFAYQEGKNLHLPNPCLYPKTDAYAKLVCHEMGHYNGWPGYHGD